VVLDDPYRNEQGGCDLLVGLSVGTEVENFLLAISQASQMFPTALRTPAGIHRYQALAWAGEQVVPQRHRQDQ
jgi:hypothetical protein